MSRIFALKNWLFPAQCVVSEERLPRETQIQGLKDSVWLAFKRNQSACPVCSEPQLSQQICGACLKQMPAFNKSFAPFIYEEELANLIQRFKFHNQLYLAPVLAEMFVKQWQGDKVDALIPVPLHKSRLGQRGFNQARELAKEISKLTGIPLLEEAVTRAHKTPIQSQLSREERLKNLNKAFDVQAAKFEGVEKVALIDDVMTTNATMQACAKAIKKQTSIAWVEAWAIAKTPKS